MLRTLFVLSLLLMPNIAMAECMLIWDASPTPTVIGYRVYISADIQAVRDRTVPPIETPDTQILCTTGSVDLMDYAAVSAYDDSNESPLSNIAQRRDLVNPKNMRVKHFIEATE